MYDRLLYIDYRFYEQWCSNDVFFYCYPQCNTGTCLYIMLLYKTHCVWRASMRVLGVVRLVRIDQITCVWCGHIQTQHKTCSYKSVNISLLAACHEFNCYAFTCELGIGHKPLSEPSGFNNSIAYYMFCTKPFPGPILFLWTLEHSSKIILYGNHKTLNVHKVSQLWHIGANTNDWVLFRHG